MQVQYFLLLINAAMATGFPAFVLITKLYTPEISFEASTE